MCELLGHGQVEERLLSLAFVLASEFSDIKLPNQGRCCVLECMWEEEEGMNLSGNSCFPLGMSVKRRFVPPYFPSTEAKS